MTRGFRLLWLAMVISRFGTGFFGIAIIWLVYARTGSLLVLGAIVGARMAASAAAKIATAPLTDRLDRRRLLIALDVARAVTTGLPLLLAALGSLQTWELYAVFIVASVLMTPYLPAANAMVPRLVDRSGLVRANAWLQGGLEVMYLVGPAVGGLFIAFAGAPQAMGVDAATFAASALLLLGVREPSDAPPRARQSAPYTRALGTGWRTLRGVPTLAALAGLQATAGTTDIVFGVMMVPLVRTVLHGSAAGVGLLEASLSAGAVAAASIATHAVWARRPLAVWLSVPAFCLLTAALAVAPSLAWAMALQAGAGLALGLFRIRSDALFQGAVDDTRLGQTLAARDALRFGTASGGALVAGALGGIVGVAGSFGAFGLAGALLSGALVWTARRGDAVAA